MANATPTFVRAAGAAAIFGALALFTRRPEYLILAAPFTFATLIAVMSERALPCRARIDITDRDVSEGELVELVLTVSTTDSVDALEISIASDPELIAEQATHFTIALEKGQSRDVVVRYRAATFGRFFVGPVRIDANGPLFATVSSSNLERAQVIVLPALDRFRASDSAPHALAFAGSHRSRSVGPGIDFSAIRPYSVGDSLKRINWRATLKTGDLHVTSMFAERTTEVVVVIDAVHNAGEKGQSSLDIAVRAAASIAEHYLKRGDVVRIAELGGSSRIVTPRGGRRSIDQLRRWLLDVRLSGEPRAADASFASLLGRCGRGIVVVLSPLLDDRSTGLATLRMRGASVVVVDTLRDAMFTPRDGTDRIALMLWNLERELLIARLAELGMPVVAWTGSGSLDAILQDLARMAAAPRLAIR